MISTAFSTRDDGNMGLHVGDDPLRVAANRQRFLAAHGFGPDDLITADQIHGDTVTIVTTANRGQGSRDHASAIPACDALITADPDLVLGIVTADCVPILLWDEHRGVIGAVHAGWKGTARHITAKTVETMNRLFGCDPGSLHARIGPAIGPCCYAVGSDTAHACGCAGAARLDLPDLNRQQLLAHGLAGDRIATLAVCTSCRNNRYFSHRADDGRTGRIMALIGRHR